MAISGNIESSHSAEKSVQPFIYDVTLGAWTLLLPLHVLRKQYFVFLWTLGQVGGRRLTNNDTIILFGTLALQVIFEESRTSG